MTKTKVNTNILVITGTSVIPVLVAERLLKYGYQMVQVQSVSDVIKLPEVPDFFGIGIISVDNELPKEDLNEIISATSKIYPQLEFVVVKLPSQDLSEVNTDGINVTDVFNFSFETENLISRIFEIVPSEIPPQKLAIDAVTQVHLPPIEELEVLPFDVFIFLPLNKKAILYKKAGQKSFQQGLKKITISKNAPIYIRRSDFPIYSKYLSNYISECEDTAPTEVKLQVMQKKFTNVMRDFFKTSKSSTPEESQALMDSVRKIATDFIQMNSENPVVYDRIRMLVGRSVDSYAHSMNVSAYSVIFGVICGLNDSDSLSLGGLFHDIGMNELPGTMSQYEYDQLETDALKEKFLEHGQLGIEVIDRKNIPISYEVRCMIVQHHHFVVEGGRETLDEPHPYAEICAFADVFDELTSVRNGHKLMTPFEAIQHIAGMSEHNSVPLPVYNADIHEPIIQQFLLEAFDLDDDLDLLSSEGGFN